MAVSAKMVKELRDKTGAGLMDCKKALSESDGDFDKAIEYLRKKGQKVAELRAGREASEGVVIVTTSNDNKKGVALYLSCETDFVAKNEEFIGFAKTLANSALENNINSVDALLESTVDGVVVKEKVAEKVGSIGEAINVSALEVLEGENVVPYIHAGYKIGVLVALSKGNKEEIDQIGKDVAMQVAAMNPIALSEEEVAQEIVDRELAIGREQALAEGKPEQIIDRIAEGKLKKYYKENTLVHQSFVKDSSKSVAEALKSIDSDLVCSGFKRVALGAK